MREFKFRAWVDDSMWNVNGLAQSDGSDEMDLIDHSIGGYDEVHYYDYTKDCELMQYTGLKDKNGKEIYEGDIVKGHWWENGKSHRHIGIVKYGMASFSVVGVKQYLGFSDRLNPTYEVIGNIHETPELLEVKS
jgi:uncharacterized phage protein (TIGR01671 family)